ncbi:PLP-dependent aminotransferase family protein [Streptomyces sp. NRRL S-1448]|uniref:aminotransferase-like domain-containing protein n=1 Tax=Streptomyces sp. NRRL S-1448 TaxID=1463883 RepID=UPI003B637653
MTTSMGGPSGGSMNIPEARPSGSRVANRQPGVAGPSGGPLSTSSADPMAAPVGEVMADAMADAVTDAVAGPVADLACEETGEETGEATGEAGPPEPFASWAGAGAGAGIAAGIGPGVGASGAGPGVVGLGVGADIGSDAGIGPDVFDVLRAAPARIDLSPGVPDLAAFPRAAWLSAEREVLAGLPAAGFGYGDPRGAPALRRAVAGWLARYRGIAVDPEEVIITAGTAQALGLVAQVLRGAGIREIAVEDPGSLGARQHLRYWGVATPPVGVDEEGVRVEELRASGARAVLLTPAHQFPTGVVLGGARRRELMRWAAEDGGLIIEDDYDAEHRYDRPPVAALRSLLPEQVCYAGSVSKLLAPALRVGWLLAPPAYREALVDARRFADLGNAVLPQLVLARLMETGELERRLRWMRRRHRQRRDAMIAAVRRHLPGATVHGAAAGLHLTLTFGDAADTTNAADMTDAAGVADVVGMTDAAGVADVARLAGVADSAGVTDVEWAAAALERGVKVQPLAWHRQRAGAPGLVLGYAARTAGEIAEGVAVLGEVVAHAAGGPRPTRAAPPGWGGSRGPGWGGERGADA